MKTSLKIAALGLIVLGLASAQTAHAQGLYVHIEAGKNNPKITKYLPYFFKDLVDQVNGARPQITQAIVAKLSQGDLVAKGFTLYGINLTLGEAKFNFVGNDQFEIRIPGNHLYCKTTQPYVGEWGNFRVELNFDLLLKGGLKLPTSKSPKLEVSWAEVSVPWLNIKSRNFVTAVALGPPILADIFAKQLTGRSFIADAANKYLRMDVTKRLNSKLVEPNQTMAQIAKYGSPTVTIKNNVLDVQFKPVRALGKAKKPADPVLKKLPNTNVLKPPAKTADILKKVGTKVVKPADDGPIVK
jgi:hypothetical protein